MNKNYAVRVIRVVSVDGDKSESCILEDFFDTLEVCSERYQTLLELMRKVSNDVSGNIYYYVQEITYIVKEHVRTSTKIGYVND
jgi:hypothetical protein